MNLLISQYSVFIWGGGILMKYTVIFVNSAFTQNNCFETKKTTNFLKKHKFLFSPKSAGSGVVGASVVGALVVGNKSGYV